MSQQTEDYVLRLETAPIEDVAIEAYEFERADTWELIDVLAHVESTLLQAIAKMLNTGNRIAIRLVRKRFYDPRRRCHVHHMRVEADDVQEVSYDRGPIRMHASIDQGFNRQGARPRRMRSELVGAIPPPLLDRPEPRVIVVTPPPPLPWYKQAVNFVRDTWEEAGKTVEECKA